VSRKAEQNLRHCSHDPVGRFNEVNLRAMDWPQAGGYSIGEIAKGQK
jgi:hypothetical protein